MCRRCLCPATTLTHTLPHHPQHPPQHPIPSLLILFPTLLLLLPPFFLSTVPLYLPLLFSVYPFLSTPLFPYPYPSILAVLPSIPLFPSPQWAARTRVMVSVTHSAITIIINNFFFLPVMCIVLYTVIPATNPSVYILLSPLSFPSLSSLLCLLLP